MMYPVDIYVLELEEGYYYVGKTRHLKRRMSQHKEGVGGSQWTKLHPPVQRISRKTFYVENEFDEDKYENSTTIELMQKYGWQRVRGGIWCEVSEINTLVKLQKNGHFKDVKPAQVHFEPAAYTRFVLKLGGGKYYVGYTRDVRRTLRQYENGMGPGWVKEHGVLKPLKMVEFECPDGVIDHMRDLDPTVIECFAKYGYENVRGGSFDRVDELVHRKKVAKCGFLPLEVSADKI